MARAADMAYDAIRRRMLAGEFSPGAHLPEEELAAAIGVSRTPVREALRRLHAEGLVEFVANRGAHVASWTDQDLDEIFDLRALLESHGAGLAATRICPEDVERLRMLAESMEAIGADDLDKVASLNAEFHETVLAAAGNRRLVALLSAVVQTPLVHRTFRHYGTEALQRSFAHHRELVAALSAHDTAWAQAVMRAHVLAARSVLIGAPLDAVQEVTA